MPESIPIACSLDQTARKGRSAQIAELGQSLSAVRAEGASARLRFPLDRSEQVKAFVVAESRCCPFFSFDQVVTESEVELAVSAPEDAEWAVKGLVAGFVAGWAGIV